MDLERLQQQLKAEKKSIEIFKRRFEAFRILYDTVFEIETLDEEEIYHVINKNLIRISDANFAVMFTFDDTCKAIELRSAVSNKPKKNDTNTKKQIHYQEFSFIKELTEPEIEDLVKNHLLKTSLDNDCISNFVQDNQIEDHLVWRLSFVMSDELLALAFVFIDKDKDLPMRDMIDTYINVSGTILQRIRAVNKLEANKEWLSVTLQSIGDAVITTNEDGYITFINQKAEQLTGWKAEDAKDKPSGQVFKIVNEINNKPLKSPIKKVLKTRKTIELFNSTALVRKDGSLLPIEDSAAPIINRVGRVIGVVLVFHDISALKVSEQRYRESNSFMNMIIENLPNILYVKEADELRYVRINKAGEKQLGIDRREILGKKNEEIFPRKVADKLSKNEQAALISGNTIEFDEELFWKNKNTIKTLRSKIIPILNKNNEPQFILNISENITEKRKAIEAIKKAHLELNQILDASSALCVIDLNYNIIQVNKNFCNLFDLKQEEVLGRKCLEIWGNHCNSDYYCPINLIQNGEKCCTCEKDLVLDNGNSKTLIISSYPYKDVNGNIIGIVESYLDITERKKSEQKIQDIQERLNLIIKSSNDAPWDWDLIDDKVYYSPQWWSQLGYEENEMPVDKNLWKKLMCKDDIDEVNDFFEKQLNGNIDSYEVEFRLKHKDGHYVPVLSRGFITRDKSEKAIRVTGTNMDLTKIKESQKELRESEERFNLAMNATNDGLWDWNVKTNEVYYSPSWKKMLGYDSNELTNDFSTLANLLKPKDRDRKWKLLNKILNGEIDKFEIEYKMRHKKGHWIDILSRGEGIFDDTGKPIRVIGTHVDVSRLKKAENALAKSEEKYRSLFENSNDMIFIAKPNGQFIDINRAGLELLGYDNLEEIMKINIKDIIIDNSKRIEYEKKMKEDGYVKDMHFSFKCKNGNIIEVVESSNTLKDDNGEILAFRGIIRDVTQQIQDQRLLKKIIKELDNTNKQLKITQNSLIRQEKMASIGHLSAGIAHEINNPLGFVSSNFNTLKKYVTKMIKYVEDSQIEISALDENYSIEQLQKIFLENRKKSKLDFILEDVGDIFDECNEGFERIKSIVNNLKSFSRVDNEDNMAEININEIIESSLTVARNEIKYVAKVEKYLESENMIRCFKGELSQVFLNLVINAAHAIEDSDTQKGIIKIKTSDLDDKVIISIEDNGPGIKEKNINHIFDPFFTTKEQGKGTGLGLYISYDIIVNKHKGQLEALNKQEGGAIFKIILPTQIASPK
ncbi:MAG: PAS domain S-box protein [Candidatus Zixiibacteriota bacterium]